MKKITLTILLIAVSISSTKAQGLYFGVGGGYGVSAAKSTYQNSTYAKTPTGNVTTTTTVKSYSFGKGINTGLYIGYMFTKHLGAEIDGNYLMGYKFKSSWEDDDSGGNGTMQGSMIRIIPALKYMLGENKLHTYMKAGLIIGVATKVIEYTDGTGLASVNGRGYTEYTNEYTGGVSLGFHGALGINYMFTDRIGVFAEFAGYFQNWAPKKKEVKKYSVDGVDQFSTLTTYAKETDYLANLTNNYNSNNFTPPNPSLPSQQPKFYMPFSSIGFNIGLHISLERKATGNK